MMSLILNASNSFSQGFNCKIGSVNNSPFIKKQHSKIH